MAPGWVIYNSKGVPLVTSKAHDHTAADGSGPATNDEHDGYSEYDEIAAPAAPAANKGRLYVADDGGVTRPYMEDTDGDIAELAGYTLLDSVTLGAAAQTLATFANIPAKYRNLRVVWHGHSDNAVDQLRWVCIRFNNDTGNNYNWQYVADAGGVENLATSLIVSGVLNGLLLVYPTWGSIDVLNYADTSLHKVTVSHSGYIAAGDIIDVTGVGHWSSVAAINRVDIFSDNAATKFETGSTAFLYGY